MQTYRSLSVHTGHIYHAALCSNQMWHAQVSQMINGSESEMNAGKF